MNLQLSLKTKWFEMTKAEIKTEDYREINLYWCKRLLQINEELEHEIWIEMIETISNQYQFDSFGILGNMKHFGVSFKKFDYNIMTLGYPKSTDTEHILKLEHKGIEIGYGKSEWGAEPNKLYFIIKHGNIIK